MTLNPAEWIAVEWGASRLRAWAIGADGALQARAGSDAGMEHLTRDELEPALLALIEPWLRPGQRVPVIACGAIGGREGWREGWREVPFRAVPCAPVSPGQLVDIPTLDPRIALRIVPGLCQSVPADVMSGEETRIAGYLALEPDFDGVLCLTGANTKWAHISAGEVVSFQTCMTGELFALLSERSALRHCMADDGWDDAAFTTALNDAKSRPEKIAARLFSIRAEALLSTLPPASARSRLSGLLVGIELAATRPYWLGRDVVILGGGELARAYAAGLAEQGLTARLAPEDDMACAGLAIARAGPRETGR